MTINSLYGVKLSLTVEDIIQIEKRHIKVLFLKRLLSLKNG
jgi:hypothetical protein